jgi:Predicted membrane protein
MSLLVLVGTAVGLSMDAFAVAICKGVAIKKVRLQDCLLVGAWFGGFQALMPLIGYLLGVGFKQQIEAFDHWIAFALLSVIGINMIRDAFSKGEDGADASLKPRKMVVLAIATSIDALAVGVTFALLSVNIWLAITLIGICTFLLSAIGVKIGNVFGEKYKSKAELAGGVILILLGSKILIEHLTKF